MKILQNFSFHSLAGYSKPDLTTNYMNLSLLLTCKKELRLSLDLSIGTRALSTSTPIEE